jgi:hypothetical protein
VRDATKTTVGSAQLDVSAHEARAKMEASPIAFLKGIRVAQFVNVGSELKLHSDKAQRYVITGRATGKVTEVLVEAGGAHTVSADGGESLRVEAFDVDTSNKPEGGIDFRLTQV